MCLNQLLRHEQIAMMRHHAATDRSEIDTQLRILGNLGELLGSHAYPHRPYLARRRVAPMLEMHHVQ